MELTGHLGLPVVRRPVRRGPLIAENPTAEVGLCR